MTGYRVGYACAPPAVAAALGKVQGQLTSCAGSVSQHAALAALEVFAILLFIASSLCSWRSILHCSH